MSRATASPTALARAVEDLRGPYHALLMASAGISAAIHAGTATEEGVFFLLEAVGDQLNTSLAKLEQLTRSG